MPEQIPPHRLPEDGSQEKSHLAAAADPLKPHVHILRREDSDVFIIPKNVKNTNSIRVNRLVVGVRPAFVSLGIVLDRERSARLAASDFLRNLSSPRPASWVLPPRPRVSQPVPATSGPYAEHTPGSLLF